MPTPSWRDRKEWNKEVQEQIDALSKVIKWNNKWEGWGNDDKNKDWYTARAAGRAKHYLQLAEIEMYDLQYNPDEQWKTNWREALDIDD